MEIAFKAHRLLLTYPQRHLTFLAPFRLPNFHLNSKLGFYKSYNCRAVQTMSISLTEGQQEVKVKEKIQLNEKEKQIFDRLLQVVTHFNLQTQLRVAGGWVRDKLLGKECYDIDIALDNMLGKEFCEKVNEFLLHSGEDKCGIGVIQCNPDQSKHLETARMRLYDIWIDFVNLRSENYSENSRIPTMTFGTAKDDAYRRDLTINSLFYNINTNAVEDFTERGIKDLKSGKIVTPLPPKETFLDDPLRVLRAIRFGARFGFVLDKELKEAASSDEVKAAIADKISRERIGHEIDLMISGNEPVKAMAYICELQLFWVVFSLPCLPHESGSPNFEDRLCVAYVDAAWSLLQVVGYSTFNDDQRRLYLYGVLFLPLRKSMYSDNKGKKAIKVPVVNHIFRNSLKLKASDAETVINLHVASERFVSLVPFLTSKVMNVEEDSEIENFNVPDTSKQRIVAGKLLREIKGFWRVSLLISTLIFPSDSSLAEGSSEMCAELDKSSQMYRRVENIILELGLDNVWEMKPLVNGKEIMSILQLKTGGPQVKEWQNRLVEWQLAYPSGTAEECLDWMRQTHSKRAKLK